MSKFLLDGRPFPFTGVSFFNAIYNPAFNANSEAQYAKIKLVDCHNSRLVNCADDYHANKEENLPDRVHWVEDISDTNAVRTRSSNGPCCIFADSRAENTAHR